ncbi:hypothetical protein FSP39_022206 [Pinctada imbricata]|uniref:ENTH domain-containing protein n=1 Tax=Pinctada imbricata TaxID=66713 RepID=A0AA88XSW0_PINIB|nr:hypothetical protein FSP39_022206 [Pinctada imbricata]
MANMPPIRRTIKNVVKNYSEAQVKVREATSNDPWGPSSTLMGEIADLTYNVVAFTEIMQMIWKRLNDHGKNWRHVYKSLVLLEYITKTGSEKVAQQCKENIYAIQTLQDFQYREDNKDQGKNVREKAKHLVGLLKDDERLKNERAKALKAKERFAQNAMGIGSNDKVRHGSSSPSLQSGAGGYSDPYGGATGSNVESPSDDKGGRTSTDIEYARPASVGEEEIQLQLALAMSKEEHDESVKKQKSDDIKLQLALEESRKAAVEEKPAGGLLDLESPHSQQSDTWGQVSQAPAAAPTDPWGAPLPAPPSSGHRAHHAPAPAPAPAQTMDPWGSPAKPAPPQQSSVDPWGAPVGASPAPQPPPPAQTLDPWSSPAQSGGASASQASPWGETQQHSPVPAGFDSSFGSGMTNGTGQNNLDDGFDLLSSRSTQDSPAKPPGNTNIIDSFDPLSDGGSSDPWNMDGMNKNLPSTQQQQQPHRKTPQDFLGENANLVNLDQLVSKDTTTKNPFASGNTNPFEQQQALQQPQRMTLNQLQSTAYTSGFSQPSSSGLLPQPLMPVSGQTQPQQQGYNPFL